MLEILIECRGGVVQEVTLLGGTARVMVIDWDELAPDKRLLYPVSVRPKFGVDDLTPEIRRIYEQGDYCASSNPIEPTY